MIVLFFSMVGSFALLLDRPSPGQPTNDNLRAGHVYIIYSVVILQKKHPHKRGEDSLRDAFRLPELGNTPTSVGKTHLRYY